MEEKVYRIKINEKKDNKDYNFGVRNVENFIALLNTDEFIIINNKKNVKTICEALIDLYEKTTQYNLLLTNLKNKIYKQYTEINDNNRALGFVVNDELNRMAIKEYEIEDFKNIDLFSGKYRYIVEGLSKMAKEEKKLKKIKNIEYSKEEMELEDIKNATQKFDTNVLTITPINRNDYSEYSGGCRSCLLI